MNADIQVKKTLSMIKAMEKKLNKYFKRFGLHWPDHNHYTHHHGEEVFMCQ
jgi:hypothetical protein